MAFWRERLLEIGGFDPIYRAAGDDVDVCWKLLDRGYEIRFHPSALVWHRRRNSVKAFWRQQLGYGKAEALVEHNHLDKFNSFGQATWQGVIYGPTSMLSAGARLRRAVRRRAIPTTLRRAKLLQPALGSVLNLGPPPAGPTETLPPRDTCGRRQRWQGSTCGAG